MLNNPNPRLLLGIGIALLLLGFVLPVLMVMQVVESTFFLNFFSYIASLLGLMLGIIGLVFITSRYRRK